MSISEELLMRAITDYFKRYNRDLFLDQQTCELIKIYNEISIALFACTISEFYAEYETDSFRKVLNSEDLELLEKLEEGAAYLINDFDMNPVDAVHEANQRLKSYYGVF